MREKGQQSAKILTHLVTYRGKKKEKCLFLLYVGRCKGKTDICLFLFPFFSMNLSLNRNMFGKDHLWRCEVWSIALTFIVFWILTGDCSIALIFNSIMLLFANRGFEASLMMGWKRSVGVEQQERDNERNFANLSVNQPQQWEIWRG